MKSILLLATASLFTVYTSQALDISQTLPLERYTIESNDTLQYDVGHMLDSGKFSAITSTDMGLLGFSISDFQPISGKPIMIEEEFDDYKAAGVIPHWVRSREDFSLGFETYVIVSVAGGPDPNPAITVQTQPQSQIALVDTVVFFGVEASPAEYISYQWLFDGKAIPGQNASFLLVDAEKTTQSGNYSVAMNTGGKNVISKVSGLKVILPVTIATGPKSQTVKAGHGAVFRVAAKGTSPYTYQWYFNNGPIPKATSSSFVIPKTEESNVGTYSVIVGNELSTASASATLTVNP